MMCNSNAKNKLTKQTACNNQIFNKLVLSGLDVNGFLLTV